MPFLESSSVSSHKQNRRRNFALPSVKALKEMLADFGIASLRPGQREVIESVLSGRDTLAILPTGGGKSLCYQIPALVMPGTTVVVSPLIALMKDQVEKLQEAGVAAEQVNSALNTTEEERALRNIMRSRSEIVFVTPERLEDEAFLASLQKLHIDLFVVDEAHCISQWGHDFRPAFLGLARVIHKLGRPPILGLTATATEEVTRDIALQLGMRKPKIVNNGIYRSNLHYQVVHVTNEDEKLSQAVQLVREHEGSGIVYGATVKAVEALYHALATAGEQVARYHGKLPARQRKESQERFMSGDARVMVHGSCSLAAIMNKAKKEWLWIDNVPAYFMRKEPKRRVRTLTHDQVHTLLSELPTHQRHIALFALCTGLRQNNVKNLTWSQVDLDKQVAFIQVTKNGDPLGVPLNVTAVKLLEKIKSESQTTELWDPVFTYRGKVLKQVNTKAWRRALLRADIKDFRWHDLRHVWATWHVQNGTPLFALQELAGWKSEEMIRRYAYLAPDHLHQFTSATELHNYCTNETGPKGMPLEPA